jgi:hypothetical protein
MTVDKNQMYRIEPDAMSNLPRHEYTPVALSTCDEDFGL